MAYVSKLYVGYFWFYVLPVKSTVRIHGQVSRKFNIQIQKARPNKI